MTYARKVTYNTAVQIIGRLMTSIVSLATVALLNSTLQAEGWGIYSAVTTYIGFFAVFADMGINTLYLREVSRYPEKEKELTAEYLGFRLSTALFLMLLAPLAAMVIPAYSHYQSFIWIISLGQFFLLVNQIFVNLFQARLVMARAVFTDSLGRVAVLVGIVLVAHFYKDQALNYIFWAVVIGNALNMVSSYLLANALIPIRLTFQFSGWKKLFFEALPMGALTVLGMIHFKADSFILTIFRPVEEVGIYGNSYKIIEVLLTFPGMFVGSLFPAIARAVIQKDTNLHNFIQKAFDLLLFIALPLIAIIFVLAPYIIPVLTRNNIYQSTVALQILVLAMIPWFLGSLSGNVLIAHDKQKQLSLVMLTMVALNICLNILIIPRYSFYGAATVTVLTEALTTLLSFVLLKRYGLFTISWKLFQKVIPISIVITLLLAAIDRSFGGLFLPHYIALPRLLEVLVLLGLGIVCGIFYLIPHILFKTFPSALQERIERLRPRHNKVI